MTLNDYLQSIYGQPMMGPSDIATPGNPALLAQGQMNAQAMNAQPMQPPQQAPSLSSYLSDPAIQRGLLAMGAQLLRSSGPSRMPTTLGQVLGSGAITGINAADSYRQQQAADQQQKINNALKLAAIQAKGAKQWRKMTPTEVKQYYGGAAQPGYTYLIDGTGNVKVVGENPYKTMSVIDSATGTPINTLVDTRNPAAISATKPDTNQLAMNQDKLANMIATYQIKPSAYLLRSPQGQITMSKVQNLNPSYDEKLYDQYNKAYKDWSSGRLGQNVNSANKTIAHLSVLQSIIPQLDNTSSPAYNKVANYAKTQFGMPAPKTFDVAKQIVSDELTKFIIGTGGGVTDREKAQDAVNKADSPEQLQAVIDTWKRLMADQLNALKLQYTQNTGRSDFDSKLFPSTVQELNTADAGIGAANTGQPQADPLGIR